MNRPLDDQPLAVGAHSTRDRKKKGWLLWLILALVALAALAIWAIVHNSNDDDDATADSGITAVTNLVTNLGTTTAATTAATTATTGRAAPVTSSAAQTTVEPVSTGLATPDSGGAGASTIPPATTAVGPLAADSQDLIAISNTPGAFTALIGQPAGGQAIVQAVISDEGFWVGTDEINRVFVFLSDQARGTTGESPFQVMVGQNVQIIGDLVTSDGNIPDDVTDADGRQQLIGQGALVNATSLALVS